MGAGLAAPSFASGADSVPAVPYTTHATADFTAESLGLNSVDPTASEDESAPASIAGHATARVFSAPFRTGDADAQDDEDAPQRSLSDLVRDYASAETPDAETDCLARAVYYESKGEPLAGQLTVADVVMNRAESGRFPSTICGVVRQRGQFSFVHGGHIPTPPEDSRDWHVAVAIAQIAMQDLADGSAPDALFFHARSVHPGWRLTRVASVGNHVFYR